MNKPYKVHMLPCEDKSHLTKRTSTGKLEFYEHGHGKIFVEPQHLYCTSGEVPKEWDWALLNGKTVTQVGDAWPALFKDDPKIVATTDPKLWGNAYVNRAVKRVIGGENIHIGIAKIPLSMIQAYVTCPFDEVMLEIDKEFVMIGGQVASQGKGTNALKLNSAGEVIWSLKEEKMYTRAEVKDIIFQSAKQNKALVYRGQFEEWFDKQYPK